MSAKFVIDSEGYKRESTWSEQHSILRYLFYEFNFYTQFDFTLVESLEVSWLIEL